MGKERVLIIGAGGHSRVILDILSYDKNKEVIGFTDSNKNMHGKKINNITILGDDSIIEDEKINEKLDSVIIGLGWNLIKRRRQLYKKVKGLGIKFSKAIHPSAIMAKSIEIGSGSVVMAGAIINPYTTIKDNCVINTGAIIDHDNLIENGVFIQPGATLAGSVQVGEDTMVGVGATVLDGKKIGKNVIVGAGSIVTKDVPDNVVVVGIPAKKIRDNEEV